MMTSLAIPPRTRKHQPQRPVAKWSQAAVQPFASDPAAGMAITEFVILAPVILLLIAATLTLNSWVDQKIQNQISVRNLAFNMAPPPKAGITSTSKSQSHSQLITASAGMHETMGDKAAQLSQDDGNQWDIRARYRSFADSDWRNQHHSRLTYRPEINLGLYTNTSDFAGQAAALTINITQALKKPLGKWSLFIDDSATLLETQIDQTIQEDGAALSSSLKYLGEMVLVPQRHHADQGPEAFLAEPTTFSQIHYRETETGYRPWDYHWGPFVGYPFVLRDTWASGHYSRIRMVFFATKIDRHWHRYCAYGAFANDHCAMSFTAYTTTLQSLAMIKSIASLIADIFSGNGASSAADALNAVTVKAGEAITNQIADKVTHEITTKISDQVLGEFDRVIAKVTSNLTNLKATDPDLASKLLTPNNP